MSGTVRKKRKKKFDLFGWNTGPRKTSTARQQKACCLSAPSACALEVIDSGPGLHLDVTKQRKRERAVHGTTTCRSLKRRLLPCGKEKRYKETALSDKKPLNRKLIRHHHLEMGGKIKQSQRRMADWPSWKKQLPIAWIKKRNRFRPFFVKAARKWLLFFVKPSKRTHTHHNNF